MLITFSVGNFLSFKEIQTLDMVADSLKELKTNLHTPYLYNDDERLLKSVAVYGHNSHGKSNLIKAFKFFHHLIFTSFPKGQKINYVELEPFLLNAAMKDKPTFFEITFLIKDIKYRYRVAALKSFVVQEELYYSYPKIRENYLFERVGQDFKFSKQWNKDNNGVIDQLQIFAKPHILLLSVLLSQQNLSHITDIGRWLSDNVIIPDDYMLELAKAQAIYSDSDYTSLILKFISAADLGFNTIFDRIDGLNKSNPSYGKKFLNMAFDREIRDFELYTSHSVFDATHKVIGKIDFPLLKNESAGTVKYFVIVCLLAYAIRHSQLIWVDELDSRFHSLMLEMLISSFHNPEINPINSQMIFTTHNTHLLENNLRRDQMVIVEKNQWGESRLKRAHTSDSPIRIGKSLEKEYRKGNLGGVSKRIKKDLGPTLFD